MTPEPCSTCKGLCCGSLYHDEWGSPPLRLRHVRPTMHSCPDCYDGTHEICPNPEPAPEPVRTYEDGVAAATARIVAWLRQEADAAMEIRFARRAGDFAYAADAIERGEHVTEVKP